MKTVRYNTFETNSSSTHAYCISSIDTSNRVDLNIIPSDDGIINLRLASMDGNTTPQSKISHMLLYANTIGNQEMFDRIFSVVENHTGAKLIVSCKLWVKDKWVSISDLKEVTNPHMHHDIDGCKESVGDIFYSFANEYGHGSVDQFIEDMNDILSSEENLKKFFFSSDQGVSIETYYN